MNMEEIKITDRFNFRCVLKLATQNIVVYSSFLKNYDDELILSVTEGYFKEQIYKAGYKLTKEDWEIVDSYSDQDDYYPTFNFECEIIEQCTGLKDKNGEYIYEGDTLKPIHSNAMWYRVIWKDSAFKLESVGPGDIIIHELYLKDCGDQYELITITKD